MALIPLPQMSEFLLEEFMLPMKIDEYALSKGKKIPLFIRNVIKLRTEGEKLEKKRACFGKKYALFSVKKT